MRITRSRRPKGPRAGEAVILFQVGPTTFAISAAAVEEIRNLEGLQPLDAAFAHAKLSKCKYLLERDNKVYYVVDSNLHFRLLPTRATRLLVLRGLPAAVLVDSIDRMTEVHGLLPLPRAFTGEERSWYRGLAVIQGDVVPVVNPGAFLTKAEFAVLQASLPALAAAGREVASA